MYRKCFPVLLILPIFVALVFSHGPMAANAQEARSQAIALSDAFRNAAEQIMPATVKITSSTKPRVVERRQDGDTGQTEENPFEGTPFEDFFKGMPGRGGNFQFKQQIPSRQGLGSGILIDSSGVILTNNHVVEGADEVVVTLRDGRQFTATDIKTDPQTDIAILRIKANESLPAAKMGDSDTLRIGDWVIAVGHPFDYEQTVSAGIVSGVGRDLNGRFERGLRSRFIQTDAAINPGNSGGPLVNLDGEVIGINTAIASSGGGFQGIGFAVPVNMVKWVSGQLIARGSVERAWLGVGIQDITADISESFGIRPGQGVAVTKVWAESPAAEAGFQAGDIILDFAGQKVSSSAQLQEVTQQLELNSKQPVNVLRNGKSVQLTVTMRAMPDETKLLGASGGLDIQRSDDHSLEVREFGFTVAEFDQARAAQEKMGDQGGVYVIDIDQNGPAARSSLRQGMRILQINNSDVADLQSFKTAVSDKKDASRLVMLVEMGGAARFVAIRK